MRVWRLDRGINWIIVVMMVVGLVGGMGRDVWYVGCVKLGLKGRLLENDNHNFKIELESLGWGLVLRVNPKYLLRVESAKMVA